MLRYSKKTLLGCVTVAAFAMLSGAACSSANDEAPETTAAPGAATPSSELALPEPAAGAQGALGISPNGVTTSIDVPADATESQYGQACHAAKLWLDQRHEDPRTLVEPYLETLQDPGFVGPGSFDTPWVQLSREQQAGVIMAANAAANGDCG